MYFEKPGKQNTQETVNIALQAAKELGIDTIVVATNTGDTADYQGLDVTGKIAVVMRGGLSFEQKQLNAASAGAAGCIIYNNRDGYLLNMAVDNYKIPTVCISLANGQMMEAAQEKTLTVSKTEKGSVAMSDFSSWGRRLSPRQAGDHRPRRQHLFLSALRPVRLHERYLHGVSVSGGCVRCCFAVCQHPDARRLRYRQAAAGEPPADEHRRHSV